jgi:hypothetical protein
MRTVSIVNRTRNSVLGTCIGVADQWWQRARGFLRRPEPREGEGLLLSPCRAVHMVGMAFPLDVIFVNRHGEVLALYAGLSPGRRSGWHRRAKYALEVPAGTIDSTDTRVGDVIAWSTSEPDLAATGASFATASIVTDPAPVDDAGRDRRSDPRGGR